MFVRPPGMRRSCRTATWLPARRLSRAPSRSSPTAPRFYTVVLPRGSDRPTARRPNLPQRLRLRCSSAARRRSYSRRAEAPGVPLATGIAVEGGCCPLAVQHGTHQVCPVLVLATRTACAARAVPHEAHAPG